MPYIVEGLVFDPVTGKQEKGTGAIEVEADSLSDAQEKARNLRAQGLEVRVINPLGDPILDEDMDHRID